MDEPWSYAMHPEAWLKSIEFPMEPEVDEVEKPMVAPHTPWSLEADTGGFTKPVPHPDGLWGEYLEEGAKKPTILQIEAPTVDEEFEPTWAPPPELWHFYLNAIEVTSDPPTQRKQSDREKILEDKGVSCHVAVRARYPMKDMLRDKIQINKQESITKSTAGNEWLSKAVHHRDGMLLLNATFTNEVPPSYVLRLKGRVVPCSTPTYRVGCDINPDKDEVVVYEYPDDIGPRPYYGMVHRLVTHTTMDPSLPVPNGQKVLVKPGDTLPEVLDGTIQFKKNESFTMIRSTLLQAPLARVEGVTDFMIIRTWREAPLRRELVKKNLTVFHATSADRLRPGASATKVSSIISSFTEGVDGKLKIKVETMGKMTSECSLEDLTIREEVYKIWPIQNYYRVVMIEPIYHIPKKTPSEYWKRRIKHTAVIMHECMNMDTEALKRKALDSLIDQYNEVKPATVKSVYDDHLKTPLSIADLLKSPDKLTPEECIAVEVSARWRKYLSDGGIPKNALNMNVDKLSQLCNEIESFERQRSLIGEVFPMLTPRLKWQIEKLQQAPWSTSSHYQAVLESKNLFFKLGPKSQILFFKTTTQDPAVLLEDDRTPSEVNEELQRLNVSEAVLANKTPAERLDILQRKIKEDKLANDLRRKFDSKERAKLSALEVAQLYKTRVNEIFRRKIRLMSVKPTNEKAKKEIQNKEEVYRDFEADLLADSSSDEDDKISNPEERAEIEELRKMMGLQEEEAPKKEVKKMKQLRVVQIEKDPNGNFVCREMFIYDEEIEKYYAYCRSQPEGGYMRAPLPEDEEALLKAPAEPPASGRGRRQVAAKRGAGGAKGSTRGGANKGGAKGKNAAAAAAAHGSTRGGAKGGAHEPALLPGSHGAHVPPGSSLPHTHGAHHHGNRDMMGYHRYSASGPRLSIESSRYAGHRGVHPHPPMTPGPSSGGGGGGGALASSPLRGGTCTYPPHASRPNLQRPGMRPFSEDMQARINKQPPSLPAISPGDVFPSAGMGGKGMMGWGGKGKGMPWDPKQGKGPRPYMGPAPAGMRPPGDAPPARRQKLTIANTSLSPPPMDSSHTSVAFGTTGSDPGSSSSVPLAPSSIPLSSNDAPSSSPAAAASITSAPSAGVGGGGIDEDGLLLTGGSAGTGDVDDAAPGSPPKKRKRLTLF